MLTNALAYGYPVPSSYPISVISIAYTNFPFCGPIAPRHLTLLPTPGTGLKTNLSTVW